MAVPAEARELVDRLRAEVAALHSELVTYQLVVWTAGNVSARVPGYDLMVIKPSGVRYDQLTAQNMVVTDLFGEWHDGAGASGMRAPGGGTAYRALLPATAPGPGCADGMRKGIVSSCMARLTCTAKCRWGAVL